MPRERYERKQNLLVCRKVRYFCNSGKMNRGKKNSISFNYFTILFYDNILGLNQFLL